MTERDSFRSGWRPSLRAVLAVVKKDWLHFVRYPLNMLFGAIQPLMWLTPIYFMGKSFAAADGNLGFAAYAGTSDYMSYVLVGAVLSNYVSAVLWGMGYALRNDMVFGVLESNWLTPMSRPLMLVGQTLCSIAITTVNSALVLLLGWLMFGFRVSGNLVVAALVAVPMLIALYGFGFGFAALVLLIREPNTLIDVSDYTVSMLAGRQFPVQVLPKALLPVSLAIPLTYGFDAIRGYLLNTETILPIRYEVAILFVFMGVMAPVGYAVFEVVERRCKRLGTLGMH